VKMNAVTVRKELKRYIDAIPENNLEIVRPMLSYLAGNRAIYEPIVIETNLTPDEKAVVLSGRKERMKHPENFTSWTKIKNEPETSLMTKKTIKNK